MQVKIEGLPEGSITPTLYKVSFELDNGVYNIGTHTDIISASNQADTIKKLLNEYTKKHSEQYKRDE